jgi:hypothetical protein
MNGNIRYELAKTMIADRQRKTAHAATVAQARAARRTVVTDARAAQTLARRTRALLRPRTA